MAKLLNKPRKNQTKPRDLRRLCNGKLRQFFIFLIGDKRVEEAVVTWFIIV
jgi:hypothetical protein